MSTPTLFGAVPNETADLFDLDVTLLEVTDSIGQIAATDDGCGSTCGACVSNAS